jgi:hypothetical protein
VIDPVATGAAAASGSVSSAAATASGSATSGAATSDAVSRGFEQLLVQELAKELLATTGESGNAYASLLPNALAQAVEDGGGLGLDLQVPGS